MRRKTFLLLTVAAAFIGGAVWLVQPPLEPEWRGEKLSHWFPVMPVDYRGEGLTPDDWRDMGAPAVRWLAYKVEHGRHPEGLQKPSFVRWIYEHIFRRRPYDGPDERTFAAQALADFGPKAEPAMHALVRAIDTGDNYLCRYCASSLNGIGHTAWPVVDAKLTSGSVLVRSDLLATLAEQLPKPL